MSLVDGVLLDVDGVLVSSWVALPGAVEVVGGLRGAGVPFRLLTNTTVYSQEGLWTKLNEAGFDVRADEVRTPVTVTATALKERFADERVLVLASKPARDDLAVKSGIEIVEGGPAAAVVIGDTGDDEELTHAQLDGAFRALVDGAAFIAMHRNLYWRTAEGLSLDIGTYVVGLEAASGVVAEVMGKPDASFFRSAAESMGVEPARAAMFGDDVDSDVRGAIAAGLQGVLVQTGKFREADLRRLPDGARTVGSVADLLGLLAEATA